MISADTSRTFAAAGLDASPGPRRPAAAGRFAWLWLLLPLGVLYALLVAAPLGMLLRLSLTDGAAAYGAVLSSRLL
ncbi:MAG TPA: hypothetical protein VHB27_08915, partial [Rhodopila sp.]|uniref:hypothetical protein n=1 Tax=Rhodopila sp. TaxID=2480087 RepID=UPI002CE51212